MAEGIMKKILSVIMAAGIVLLSGCGRQSGLNNADDIAVQSVEQPVSQSMQTEREADHTDENGESGLKTEHVEKTEEAVEVDQIYIQVGENTLTAVLEGNESTEALKELLADGPLTIPASNYGGFEKVCSLGTELPRNDSHTTTQAGDICLYNGNQIVIFYGSNSWAYTRLGKISNTDDSELEEILSGEETEITLSLEASH